MREALVLKTTPFLIKNIRIVRNSDLTESISAAASDNPYFNIILYDLNESVNKKENTSMPVDTIQYRAEMMYPLYYIYITNFKQCQ